MYSFVFKFVNGSYERASLGKFFHCIRYSGSPFFEYLPLMSLYISCWLSSSITLSSLSYCSFKSKYLGFAILVERRTE